MCWFPNCPSGPLGQVFSLYSPPMSHVFLYRYGSHTSVGKSVNYKNVSSYLHVCTGRKETDNKNANLSNLSVSGQLPELELLFQKAMQLLRFFAIMLLSRIFLCVQRNYCIIFSRGYFFNWRKTWDVDSDQENMH